MAAVIIFLEADNAPRTWILEKYGGLFKELEWDVTYAHRLPILADAFPNLETVTVVNYDEAFLPEKLDEPNYWLMKENEQDLLDLWHKEIRRECEPTDIKEWTGFLKSGEKTFKLEALVDLYGEGMTEMVGPPCIYCVTARNSITRRSASTYSLGKSSVSSARIEVRTVMKVRKVTETMKGMRAMREMSPDLP